MLQFFPEHTLYKSNSEIAKFSNLAAEAAAENSKVESDVMASCPPFLKQPD